MIHIVQRTGVLYPVNWLRNLIIRNASTEYIVVIDADFLPSANLMSSLLAKFKDLRTQNLDSNHAIIIPAFEQFSDIGDMTNSKDDVIKYEYTGDMDVFHRKWHPDGHRIWKYDVWKESKSSYILPKETLCSEPEPYIAVRTSQSPLFPEILLERGKNKVAYHFEMCISDFRFVVLHDAFLVHKPHAESFKAGLRVDRCVTDAWSVYRTHLARVHGKSDAYKPRVPGFVYNLLYVLLCVLVELLWLLLLTMPLLCLIIVRKLLYSR